MLQNNALHFFKGKITYTLELHNVCRNFNLERRNCTLQGSRLENACQAYGLKLNQHEQSMNTYAVEEVTIGSPFDNNCFERAVSVIGYVNQPPAQLSAPEEQVNGK